MSQGWPREGSEEWLQKAVAQHGAVLSSVNNWGWWDDYKNGVSSDYIKSNCKYTSSTHTIAVVGYGTLNGKDYWLIKNSWGTAWGDNGYIKLERGVGACGIGRKVAYPICEGVAPPTTTTTTTSTPPETVVENGKVLGTLATWGPTYKVSLDIFVKSFPTRWLAEVLSIGTTDKTCCTPGANIPSLKLSPKGRLAVFNQVNTGGRERYNWHSGHQVTTNQWHRVEMEQWQRDPFHGWLTQSQHQSGDGQRLREAQNARQLRSLPSFSQEDKIFVHWEKIVSSDRFPQLEQGMDVEFSIELVESPERTIRAKDVSLPGGLPITSFGELTQTQDDGVHPSHFLYQCIKEWCGFACTLHLESLNSCTRLQTMVHR